MSGARPPRRRIAPPVPHVRAAALAVVVAALCAAGCAGGPPEPHRTMSRRPPPASSVSAPVIGPDGRPGCRPASPIGAAPAVPDGGPAGPEVRGTGRGATLYGLIMAPGTPPFRAGTDVKIVWRMTGDGELRLSATGPGGRRRRLVWGPEEHGGSTYRRPGREWGAGYRFDRPGCWKLHAALDTGTADVWIRVS